MAAKGGEKQLKAMQKLLELDPQRNELERSNPRHLINMKNALGQTPLYVAAKHGNILVVRFLLREGADPKIFSQVSTDKSESLLEVTARWNHVHVFNYLLR